MSFLHVESDIMCSAGDDGLTIMKLITCIKQNIGMLLSTSYLKLYFRGSKNYLDLVEVRKYILHRTIIKISHNFL